MHKISPPSQLNFRTNPSSMELSSLFRFFKFSNKMNTKKFQMLERNQLKNGG